MVSRKRTRSEVDTAPEQPPEEPGLLHRLRNSWEFANLMQYIAMFGKPMKIDEDFGIEDLENECLKPGSSEKLLEIGLCLLKWVSSHRGLTFDNFDEYTRRQYNAKAPHLPNPFGYDEVPNRFSDFDIFLKLRVLHQLTVWTFWNPDRIRDKMPEQKEADQTQWRIEELGYDREGRYYYILDDNRLYRRTDPPIPLPPPKAAKSKTKRKSARAVRASKRRKVSEAAAAEESSDGGHEDINGDVPEDPFKRMKWECIAITLEDYRQFLDSIRKSKDPDEKILRDRVEEQVLPVIEKEEEAQERQKAKREKELMNLQLLAGAKRSSRIAGKAEKERQEREAAEAAQKREEELAAALKEEERIKKMESDRRTRIMTREQRIKERERKRILHESELERIAEEQKKLERGESRISERQLKSELEKQRKNLEDLSQEDEWVFDCSGCGTHGENLDDGSHSVACEKCNVWQHSKCLGIRQQEAEREDFHFVCKDCTRREKEAMMPKIPPLKFRVGSSPSSDQESKDVQATATSVPFTLPLNGLPSKPVTQQSLPPRNAPQPIPMSPERRPQSAHAASFGSPRALFSPSKGANGYSPSREAPLKLPSIQQAMHLPPNGRVSFNGGSFHSFHSQRPSSSHATQSPTLPSPIQNRPSMSPTQGNRDVGPLAGFPPVPSSDNAAPWTPYRPHQAPRRDSGHYASFSSIHGGHPSLAATPNASQSSPPQSSHCGVALSGISPTKQSPRPVTSGGVAGAPVLPPIQRLEPSPKLMGRSSPDAPIPPPVKCMTPEQEERRQRENAMMLHAQSHAPNRQHSAMSSPSLNRIPPLGPSALSQRPESSFQSSPGPKTEE
ncbi:hypothetical protein ETB97_011525 [Aspergillus alliaceus]|uniref:PHD-type domain-containing protein n=1 Tax=Petromyces alliaceus TaxID=209559 RepID=A0A5N6G4L1_PETAA|nr:uncharacterized protein BDW43DRAFT_252065 [Aspergillus alliaceus]KAB8236289.1 hypothetical protein BDW43DRAFT_252065 [Aspergillus alliaceus]KAE8391390.1 hypothetical protein BDV23DRAFT_153473 [Aspergillus alliaceus]KAF5862528.1 hypothetical protein ETB97_011525 [Aspergillus burnettii]